MMRIFDLFPLFREVTKNLLNKSVTVQYPYENIKVPDGFRGAPEVNPDLCIACRNCEKECPTRCIDIIPVSPTELPNYSPEQGKPFWFSINLSQCMFCQACEESCPIKRKTGQSAISLNAKRWRMAGYNLEDTIEKKLVFKRPSKKNKTNEIEVDVNGVD